MRPSRRGLHASLGACTRRMARVRLRLKALAPSAREPFVRVMSQGDGMGPPRKGTVRSISALMAKRTRPIRRLDCRRLAVPFALAAVLLRSRVPGTTGNRRERPTEKRSLFEAFANLAARCKVLNLRLFIGETGFEPATARPPAGCATRLRHSPWCNLILRTKRAWHRLAGTLADSQPSRHLWRLGAKSGEDRAE